MTNESTEGKKSVYLMRLFFFIVTKMSEERVKQLVVFLVMLIRSVNSSSELRLRVGEGEFIFVLL